MRVAFIAPTPQEFGDIFDTVLVKTARGGSLQDIEIFRVPSRSVRGGGIFSTLAGLARKVIPFIARAAKPSVVEFGRNVLTDLEDGNTDLRSSLKRRGFQALTATGRRLIKGTGKRKGVKTGGVKKKKKRKSVMRYKDVFSVM